MPIYLDTRGKTSLAIGICARCKIKYPLVDLKPDPNAPGLLVCDEDLDKFDPYRLPARQLERISVTNPRPDDSMAPSGQVPVYTNKISGISSYAVTVPWSANTSFAKGATCTPVNVNLGTTTLPQNLFLATTGGVTGASAPVWPREAGQVVQDGTVTWLNFGIYTP